MAADDPLQLFTVYALIPCIDQQGRENIRTLALDVPVGLTPDELYQQVESAAADLCYEGSRGTAYGWLYEVGSAIVQTPAYYQFARE